MANTVKCLLWHMREENFIWQRKENTLKMLWDLISKWPHSAQHSHLSEASLAVLPHPIATPPMHTLCVIVCFMLPKGLLYINVSFQIQITLTWLQMFSFQLAVTLHSRMPLLLLLTFCKWWFPKGIWHPYRRKNGKWEKCQNFLLSDTLY